MKVINCGVNAYGTVQEWIMLQKQLPVEKPRFVGVMFYENDFDDNVSRNGLRRPYCALEGSKVVLKNYPVARPISGSPFARRSYAISFLSYYVNYFKEVMKRRDSIEGTEENRNKSLRPEVIQVMEHTLGEMKTLCDSQRATLFVVYIPPADDMKHADQSSTLSGMKEICAGLHIDLLDPVQFMKGLTRKWEPMASRSISLTIVTGPPQATVWRLCLFATICAEPISSRGTRQSLLKSSCCLSL